MSDGSQVHLSPANIWITMSSSAQNRNNNKKRRPGKLPKLVNNFFLRHSHGVEGVQFGDLRVRCLLFADEVVLVASSVCDLQLSLDQFAPECEPAWFCEVSGHCLHKPHSTANLFAPIFMPLSLQYSKDSIVVTLVLKPFEVLSSSRLFFFFFFLINCNELYINL